MITTSQLRESPGTATEQPERAESPGPMLQVLRRAYGGPGGGGCWVSEDEECQKEERRREAVKLQFEHLKHLTILAGTNRG